ENGLCAFKHSVPGQQSPSSSGGSWSAGVRTWLTEESTLHVGACAGPLDRLTAGIDVEGIAVPGRGMLLVAQQQTTLVVENDYSARSSGWAVDHAGSAHALFRAAQGVAAPTAAGLIWSVSDDSMV